MDRIFTFSKWFVLFCALLIVARLALQYVADKRLSEEAQVIGGNIYTFDWDGGPEIAGKISVLRSESKVLEAKVLHRSASDAQVKITGNQMISTLDPESHGIVGQPLEDKFSAVLTFFRENKQWVLSKVEAD